MRRLPSPCISPQAAAKCLAVFGAIFCSASSLFADGSPKLDAAGKAFFESKIRPVLVKSCYECHSVKEDKLEGGLAVDTRKAIRKGGDRGAAVTPNDLEASILMRAIQYEDEDLQMPPDGKLSEEVIANFAKWIEMGAPDPREGKESGKASKKEEGSAKGP